MSMPGLTIRIATVDFSQCQYLAVGLPCSDQLRRPGRPAAAPRPSSLGAGGGPPATHSSAGGWSSTSEEAIRVEKISIKLKFPFRILTIHDQTTGWTCIVIVLFHFNVESEGRNDPLRKELCRLEPINLAKNNYVMSSKKMM